MYKGDGGGERVRVLLCVLIVSHYTYTANSSANCRRLRVSFICSRTACRRLSSEFPVTENIVANILANVRAIMLHIFYEILSY